MEGYQFAAVGRSRGGGADGGGGNDGRRHRAARHRQGKAAARHGAGRRPRQALDSGERGKLSVAVGDEVIYGKYSGSDIEVDGREVKILRETDILAKVVK